MSILYFCKVKKIISKESYIVLFSLIFAKSRKEKETQTSDLCQCFSFGLTSMLGIISTLCLS